MNGDIYLAIIYPEDKSKSSITRAISAANTAIKDATKCHPMLIHPDVTCICFLVEGEMKKISRALELKLGNDVRWLVVRCELPIESFGLNVSDTWLRNRLRGN